MDKTVSVIMATYNGEKYLIEQLDSIRLQTYRVDEMLIYDDKSTDGTVAMIYSYIEKYHLENTWHFHQNVHNLGYANNFHQGIVAATGDYIFFSDQDDIWHLDKIEKMVKQMNGNKKIKLLCSDFEALISENEAPRVPQNVSKYMKYDDSIECIPLNSKNIFINSIGCVMAITKELRNDIWPFWFEGWAHDEYVWKLAQCYEGAYFYHKSTIFRRLHGSNVSMQKKHDLAKRIVFFEELLRSHEATKRCALAQKMDEKKLEIITRNIKSLKYRIELLRDRKLYNCLPLLLYTDCYHSRKSILVEPYIVLKSYFDRKAN